MLASFDKDVILLLLSRAAHNDVIFVALHLKIRLEREQTKMSKYLKSNLSNFFDQKK